MHHRPYRRTLAALLAGASLGASAHELYSDAERHLNANVEAVFGAFHSERSYAIARDQPGSTSWREGYIKYGLSADQALGSVGVDLAFFSALHYLTGSSVNSQALLVLPVALQPLGEAWVRILDTALLYILLASIFLLVPAIIGRPIGAEVSAIITFIAFEAAYFSEIMRAGIQSIPRGQVYAGQALGMTYGQNMKLVVLPQAFRNMLPVLLTQTIILFQDTSLVYAIGAYDMLKGFEVAGKNFGRPIEAYLAAAVLYFVMCYALSWAVKRLHQKIAIIR